MTVPKGYTGSRAPLALVILLHGLVGPTPASAQAPTHATWDDPTPLLTRIDFEAPVARLRLPASLREISGLAFADGRLFAHNDEDGLVVELDPEDGDPVKWMFLGPERVLADFEGIAADGARFFLVTSGGTFVTMPEGGDGERIAYTAIETSLGSRCEVEGLARARDGRLLAVCKTNREAGLRHALRVFAFDPVEGRLAPDPVVLISHEILSTVGVDELSPSGIEVLPNGHLLVLAARERIILELDGSGRPIAWVELDDDRHRQPEGIAVTPEGEILIADEGGRGRARLTRYGPLGSG